MAKEFVETFVNAAKKVLSEYPPESYEWNGSPSKPPVTLNIRPSSICGFPVKIICQTYGVYPSALGWYGAPWDVTVFSSSALTEMLQEFLQSVMSENASLEVHHSNGKPYKYILNYTFDGEQASEEEGTIFYNWFGEKKVEIFSNNWHAEQNKGRYPFNIL